MLQVLVVYEPGLGRLSVDAFEPNVIGSICSMSGGLEFLFSLGFAHHDYVVTPGALPEDCFFDHQCSAGFTVLLVGTELSLLVPCLHSLLHGVESKTVVAVYQFKMVMSRMGVWYNRLD